MSGLPAQPTGAALIKAVVDAAKAEGVTPTAWIRERGLSHEPSRWMKMVSAAKAPLARTVRAVTDAIGGKRIPLQVELISTKRKVREPVSPAQIESMKVSSAVRLTRSRIAHAPDAKGKKGRELQVGGPIWSRIEAEADARKISASAAFDLVLSAGVFTLEEERFEDFKKKEGYNR